MYIRKALTFRASSIGDCLMGKYLLENIHQQFPNARLGIVVGSRAGMIRDLCAAYPWLLVIEANRRSPKSLISLWKDFHGSDLVVTQYAGKPGGRFSLWSKLFARLLAKKGGLIGFSDASKMNGFLYDTLLPFSRSATPASAEREALRAADIPRALEWPILQGGKTQDATSKFDDISGNYIVVHLFAGNKSRGLHPNKKRELLEALTKRFPGTSLVISGGAGDAEEAVQIAGGLPTTVIAGEATLQELMSIINRSRGVVSIDTGVAHITAQLRKPLVVLTGCLGAHWWEIEQYGAGAPITVCSRADLCARGHVSKDYPDCLNEIAVSDVVNAVVPLV
ncbi:MAG: glycosyltransferase family 9 protein [Patescibacteria group bacterium]